MTKGDLKSARAIYAKGILFFGLAIASAGILLWEFASLRFATLLIICLWSWCRSYYFAFYVIEKYVDSKYRFAGLVDFARYLIGRPR